MQFPLAAQELGDASLKNAFESVIEAYLIFDPAARGSFTRADLAKTLQDLSCPSPTKAMRKKSDERLMAGGGGASMAVQFLTSERMDEMDWDKNGCITFAEFVWSFESWIDLEEIDEDEEEDESCTPSAIAEKVAAHDQ